MILFQAPNWNIAGVIVARVVVIVARVEKWLKQGANGAAQGSP